MTEQLELIDLMLIRLVAVEKSKDSNNKEFSLFKDQVISDAEVENLFFGEEEPSDELIDLMEEIVTLSRKIGAKCKKSKEEQVVLYLEALCDVFNFSELEKIIILLGMVNETDEKYERIIGFINDNISQKDINVGIIAKIQEIDLEHLIELKKIFDPKGFLNRFILENQMSEGENFYEQKIKTKKRIVDFIMDSPVESKPLDHASYFTSSDLEKCDEPLNNHQVQEALKHINSYSRKEQVNETILVNLRGDEGTGRKLQLKHYCHKEGKGLVVINTERLLVNRDDFESNLNDIICEALMRGSYICFNDFGIFFKIEEGSTVKIYEKEFEAFLDLANIYPAPIFIVSKEASYELISNHNLVYFDVVNDKPNYEERLRLWSYYFEKYSIPKMNIGEIAVKFTFTPKQIKSTAWMIHNSLLTGETLTEDDIYEIVHLQVKHKLKESVVKVKPSYSWDDLILPNEQKRQFEDVCNRIRNANIVYEQWGFDKKIPYGRGVTIICSGPPGTGKSMSAQVLAKELNLELYRIDLSQVISKYIGETEKKLEKIFEEAKTSNAILFFDEGDSLFGKRTSVKQANDRYANIETSYLLQKIEEYEGVSIITTNLLENIDKAFLRRMQFIINFPFPDAKARYGIWKGLFPEKTPLSEEIDFEFLSETFEIAGGNIKNVVLYSAFNAANENVAINMKHILYAVRYELQKLDKLLLGEDLKEYRYMYAELLG